MAESLQKEIERRDRLQDRLFHYVLAHRGVWLAAKDMRPVAGDAWRSRVVEVRRRLEKIGLAFEWNKKHGANSAYILREPSLGPSAETARDKIAWHQKHLW